MTETITLSGLFAWSEFWAANAEGLTQEVGDEQRCLTRALSGNLVVGGGAAPLTVVHLVDAPESSPRYIRRTETAQIIRAALKRGFPKVKFSVRTESYAGGGSIRIGWTDGPTVKMVDAIAGQFEGARFDGSIDYAYTVQHWLMPDGSAMVARSAGTTGSKGYDEPVNCPKPDPKAELVSFGSTYVFTNREVSQALAERALASLKRRYALGEEASQVVVEPSMFGGWKLSADPYISGFDEWLSTMLYRHCARRCCVASVEVAPKATTEAAVR